VSPASTSMGPSRFLACVPFLARLALLLRRCRRHGGGWILTGLPVAAFDGCPPAACLAGWSCVFGWAGIEGLGTPLSAGIGKMTLAFSVDGPFHPWFWIGLCLPRCFLVQAR